MCELKIDTKFVFRFIFAIFLQSADKTIGASRVL